VEQGGAVKLELDWNKLEEVVERAIRKARSEELKEVAEAIKTLANYMKTGFEAVFKAIEEMRKTYDERLKRLEVTMGYLGGRWGRDLEKVVLELFKEALERRGVEAVKVEKLVLKTDVGVVEVNVYIHDGRGYLIEVKAVAYGDDVGWFAWRAKLAAEELARQGKRGAGKGKTIRHRRHIRQRHRLIFRRRLNISTGRRTETRCRGQGRRGCGRVAVT
jgi:hypothetical protein